MPRKLPQRDPSAAYLRDAIAARCAGDRQCPCGESRPWALVQGSDPIICAKCKREKDGKTTLDNHHIAGAVNNPTTIPIPVNDHRAELSAAQYDWPKATRENPDASPLLAGAACIRGFADTLVYLLRELLLWIADMLEILDLCLTKKLGSKWWANTELERFAPKGKRPVS